jgi:hypothetical protein
VSSLSRRPQVDDPLVPTSRPGTGIVGTCHDIGTVHQYIDVIQNGGDRRLPPRSLPESLVRIPAVAQDVRTASGAERLHQHQQAIRLYKGLATQDGDPVAVKGRIEQDVGQLVDRDEGAGIRRMEVRDPAASYLQYGPCRPPRERESDLEVAGEGAGSSLLERRFLRAAGLSAQMCL